ncbi:MAG: FAD-dependent oxidoreductase [Streptosporangiales bacterium]|nr:FAD-dependent oxidoreductase [Streptosporangiales bacterium]
MGEATKASTDVLVVGAGPTGLALACSLLQHGVPVRVVDKAPGPATTSRANILHGRGVEVLNRLGALGDLPQRSIEPIKLATYVNGRPLITLDLLDLFNVTGAQYRPMYVSQAEIEAGLRGRLAELGGAVEWDSPLVEAEQDDSGVTATLGKEQTARAGWLVGCDGARSTVRKLAGIGFPGVPVIEQFLLADVHADWGHDRSGGSVYMHRDGVVLVIPMRMVGRADDLWRLMANVPAEDEAEMDEQAIIERFRRLLPERAGVTDVRIREAAWTSVFRIHRRLADEYRRGRILLAGDAAHTHSPVGGQGMNTGFGDAENLAWKLALVARGRASEVLLDTYQVERRPLAAEVLKTTTTNTKLLVGEGPFMRFLRDRVLLPIGNLRPLQRRNVAVASQLWVSYRRGPLGRGFRFGSRPRPGDRVPDRECVRADGGATRLHGELGGRWALLVPASGADACVKTAADRLGEYVTPLTRTSRFDEVWLVRPDAHLAWRGRPYPAGLERWLEGALRHGRAGR